MLRKSSELIPPLEQMDETVEYLRLRPGSGLYRLDVLNWDAGRAGPSLMVSILRILNSNWSSRLQKSLLAIAVGTSIAGCPRTDPGGRNSRTGLPPRVVNDESHEQLRVHSRASGTRLIRHSVRYVCCSPMFPSVLSLGSTNSAPSRPGLVLGFNDIMKRSDFSCPCFIGFDSSPSRCGPLDDF